MPTGTSKEEDTEEAIPSTTIYMPIAHQPSTATAALLTPRKPAAKETSNPTLYQQIHEFIRTRAAVLTIMALTTIIGLLTVHSYFHHQPDKPNCAMSYSRPRFIEQTGFNQRWTRFATKYKLYLYREGGYDTTTQPFRIPVLFIPGNAGSHKQVRAIASASTAAFAKLVERDPEGMETRGQIGYDYFTVGLNEELTALHGYSILEQADFINDAIRYILSLYPGSRKFKARMADPTSVMVVGHSMGGVVARTAFTLPNHQVGSVQAIFTLSTPHNNPTASLEYYVDSVYTSVNDFWRHGFHNGTLDQVSLVSIAGGNLDSMINSDYTYVGDLAPSTNSLSVLSSGVNDVWLGVDHQSILWCAQMSTKFAGTLIEIMDARRPSQLVPLEERMGAMRRSFYSSLDRKQDSMVVREITGEDDYRYVETREDWESLYLLPKDLKEPRSRKKSNRALQLFPIDSKDVRSSIQVLYDPRLFVERDPAVSLLGCNKKKKLECQTLSVEQDPAKLPLKRDGDNPDIAVEVLRYHELNTESLEGFDCLGVDMPAELSTTEGFFQITQSPISERISVSPGYLRLLWPCAIDIPRDSYRLRTRLRLDVPENPLVVFKTNIVAPSTGKFLPLVRQSDSRQFESKYWYGQETLDLAIHGRGSYFPSDHLINNPDLDTEWDGLHLDIWTGPSSDISVVLRINWYSSLNRMVKRYDMALLALSFVWSCLVLLYQLRVWNTGTSGFPSCLASIEALIRNGTLAAMLIASVVTPLVQILVPHLLKGDSGRLTSWQNLFMGVRNTGWLAAGVAPAIMVAVSLGFVSLEAAVLTAVCHLASWMITQVLGRFSNITVVEEQEEEDSKSLRVPVRPLVATTCFVIFVCTFVPYQFAFLVIYLAQLFTAVRSMRQSYLSHRPQQLRDRARYQLALCLFWTSSLPYCGPELLVWIRNLSVMWFEDAPSDHNLRNMVGYFALRLLAAYHVVPRLSFTSSQRWLRWVTYGVVGVAVVYGWLWGIRRPHILYTVGNIISAWLAVLQLAEYLPLLKSPSDRMDRKLR